jgi:hypothetical protein
VALTLGLAHQAGYPLDDSWIHQDFARTLAMTHQFAYAPGRAGAGSTSPLWVVLLTPPYLLLGASPPLAVVVAWTTLLGLVALAGLAVVTGVAAAGLAASVGASERTQRIAAVLASLAVVSEWHLVWAAASGMETVLFCATVMVTLVLASRDAPPWALGLLVALAITVRPEGVLLAALLATVAIWSALHSGPSARGLGWLRTWLRRWAAPFGAALAAGCAPYALLNLRASGQLLPSTVGAKAAYYGGDGLPSALASYAEQVAVVLLLSSPVLVLLGVLSYSHWLRTRHEDATSTQRRTENSGEAGSQSAVSPRNTLRMLLISWPVLLLVVYAGRLPVLYHNGRYLMPALPALLALAAAGAVPLLFQWQRPLARAAVVLVVFAGSFSLVRGAQIYGDNVRFINACQVDTALWLREHTASGALVATHDIGAIGYFAQRPVIDMAGLVDSQVTAYLGDQPRLEAYLKARHARYVVEFTDWFSPPNTLLHDLAGHQVYQARGTARFVVLRTDW